MISGIVGWITQLVVSSEYRRQGIATVLLHRLRRDTHTAFGLLSSHPAACLALAKLGSESDAACSIQHPTHPFPCLQKYP